MPSKPSKICQLGYQASFHRSRNFKSPFSLLLTCVLLVCLVNTLHLSEERPVANGPSPEAFIIFCCTSSRLPHFLFFFSICCPVAAVNPVSVKQWMCEERRAWCLSAHVPYVDVLARTQATALLSALLSCNGARDAVFIYPPTLSSCHCCVWSEFAELRGSGYTWRTVKSTHPPNYAECYSPAHTLNSYYGQQKLSGTFKICATFIWLSYLNIYFVW